MNKNTFIFAVSALLAVTLLPSCASKSSYNPYPQYQLQVRRLGEPAPAAVATPAPAASPSVAPVAPVKPAVTTPVPAPAPKATVAQQAPKPSPVQKAPAPVITPAPVKQAQPMRHYTNIAPVPYKNQDVPIMPSRGRGGRGSNSY
ncbi:MAG: hypothetical protein R3Y56_00775 [Akkermansia sp.]